MITFSGHSDDVVEVEANGKTKEYYPSGSPPSPRRSRDSFIVGGLMRVVPVYYGGCWGFAICPVDEGAKLPDWKVEVGYDADVYNAYTAVLNIFAPEGTLVFATTE